jgi:hypothetical protein
LLVFVGIPLAAFILLWAIVMGPGMVKAPRYRPGAGWDFDPVWYLPRPDHSEPVSTLQAIDASAAASRLAVSGSVDEPVSASGGASGEW